MTPTPQVQLLFVDLDGTLIGASGDVAAELWPSLEAARAAGLRLSVCTGRPSGGTASRIAARLDPDTPHIFHGGAVVRRVEPGADGPRERAPLSACAIDTATVLRLVEQARERDLTLELYTPDAYFVDRLTPEAIAHAELLSMETRAVDLAGLAHEASIVKMQWVIGRDDAACADALAGQDLPGLHHAQANSPALPGVHFVTITRSDADKGAAVRRVAEHLGIELAHTGGVGDSSGDLPMLEVVAHPFVMGDASAALRARFACLPGVAEHGVRDLLGRLGVLLCIALALAAASACTEPSGESVLEPRDTAPHFDLASDMTVPDAPPDDADDADDTDEVDAPPDADTADAETDVEPDATDGDVGADTATDSDTTADLADTSDTMAEAVPPCGDTLTALLDPDVRQPPGRDSDGWVAPEPGELDALRAALGDASDGAAPTWSRCALEEGAVTLWLAEPGSGRAAVALRHGPARPVIVGAPHPNYETGTLAQAIAVFEQLQARALVVSGAHRCSSDTEVGCDGTTGACGGVDQPYRVSDPAHNPLTDYHAAHEALVAAHPQAWVLSLHGMSEDGVSVSNGRGGAAVAADAPVARLTLALDGRMPSGHPATSCNLWPGGEAWQREHLCGGTNVQGRLVNGSPQVCTESASTASERFLHLEQARAVRDDASILVDALAEVVPLAP